MTTGNLVLTRKTGQKVMIGDEVIVEILQAKEGEVRILFSAPENIPVHREEVYKRIRDEANEQRLQA